MALTILVRSGDGKSVPRITFDTPRIVVGRGDGCEIRLPDPSVSHRHASIRQRGTEYIVMDEGSTNGTFVGPVRLSPQAPRMLKSGDLLRVGRVWLEVCIEQAVPTQNGPQATREIALGLIAEALSAEGSPAALSVSVESGPGEGTKLVIAERDRVYVVGRMPSADLHVDDADLSRRHVELVQRASRLLVRDLGSKNGSFLGERRLTPKQETPWLKDVPLVIGKSRLTYEDPLNLALEQLESAADERIGDSDAISPPTSSATLTSTVPISAPGSSSSPRRGAPMSARPKRDLSSEPSGWTLMDFLVVLLSAIVLALSVAGLVWLMRTG